MKKLLIIFVKNPETGKVKSRLANSIGDEKARSVYKKLLLKTKDVVKGLDIDKQVCYAEFIDLDDIWENDAFDKTLQCHGDLGERMKNAFQNAFSNSYSKVCLIGSDIMELNEDILTDAFELLEKSDLVIGPSLDGGYYLIGMKSPKENLFENISWSSSSVLEETIATAVDLKLAYSLLPVLNDIDVIDDIKEEDKSYLLS